MRAKEFLFEYNRAVTAQKLGSQLLQKFRSEPPAWQQRVLGNTPEDQRLDVLLGKVEGADPTGNKQYVPWLVRSYVASPQLKFEDLISKSTALLSKFYQLVRAKKIPSPNNDIGRIQGLSQLEQVVDQYQLPEPKSKQEVNKGGAKEYYRDQDLRIIVPEDQAAACYYGQGTKWCTSATSNNMFDTYNNQGRMYIIIPTKPEHAGEKYQFHFETGQFMDEKDDPVDLSSLVARFPQLLQIFSSQARENSIPELMFSPDELAVKKQRMLKIVPGMIAKAVQASVESATEQVESLLFDQRVPNYGMVADMFSREFKESGKYFARVLTSGDVDVARLTNVDYAYEVLMEIVQDWVGDTDFYMILQDELDSEDENEVMEVSMEVQSSIQGVLADILRKVVNQAISDA